ncbi:MAG: hypothetical protein LBB84_08800 [Tannerellaceae bacterium]|jgi:hypothetical protein|nr:hypothetical protein [Tannerellaceae bacterium]
MKNYIVCLYLFLATSASFAQSDTLITRYLAMEGKHSPLYTGKIPLPYPAYMENYPYLQRPEFTEGALSYGGTCYPGIRMRLDVYHGRLLVSPPGELYEVILPPEQVDYAKLHGYHVFYFYPDSLKDSPPAGYYLLLHDGGCRVLSRPVCSMRETSRDGVVTGWFRCSTKYYILKDSVYHAVKSKGSVLKLFPSHRKELSRYIGEHRLNFRRNAEEALVAVVKRYEQWNAGL